MDPLKPPRNLILEGDVYGNWKKFIQGFNIYLTASGQSGASSEVKAAMMLNLMGEDGLDLFNTFNLSEENQKKHDEIIKAFEEYCNRKKM